MQTITVETKFGKVKDVPLTKWEELAPYWPNIAKAFFEVLMENDFNPYTATLNRPDGFVADRRYWRKSTRRPDEIPLYAARKFLAKLIQHEEFANAIRSFNADHKVDWLEKKNIHVLGGYVYSFYYTLKPVLKIEERDGKRVLKPRL